MRIVTATITMAFYDNQQVTESGIRHQLHNFAMESAEAEAYVIKVAERDHEFADVPLDGDDAHYADWVREAHKEMGAYQR